MGLFSKLDSYLRAAAVLRDANLRGLPLIPKSLWRDLPENREAFNQFILWIHSLQLPQVDCVVDVGANHAVFAQAAAALYPQAHVLLVEPLPVLLPGLERQCRRRGDRWRLEPCALGSQPGSATLHIDPQSDAIGSLVGFSEEYLKANPLAKAGQKVTCRVRTLDDLCAERGIKTIDLLKIDVEGFEFETLRGAGRMLSNTNALIIELSLVRRGQGLRGLNEMLEALYGAGFQLAACYPSFYSKEAPWLPVEFNLLARRQNLRRGA